MLKFERALAGVLYCTFISAIERSAFMRMSDIESLMFIVVMAHTYTTTAPIPMFWSNLRCQRYAKHCQAPTELLPSCKGTHLS